MIVSDAMLKAAQDALCELPAARRARYQADYKLSLYDASVVIEKGSDFADYFEAMLASETLSVSAEAREIGETVLNPPGGVVPASLVQSITAALLPPRLREAFGLTWDETRSVRVDALVASVRVLRLKPGSVDAPGIPR